MYIQRCSYSSRILKPTRLSDTLKDISSGGASMTTSRGPELSSWRGKLVFANVMSYNINSLCRYMGAVNLSNVPIEDQKLVFMGAGSAGVGVAKQLLEFYTRRGLSEAEAKDKFYLVDTKGLVTKDRGDRLAEHKKFFARHDNNGHQFKTLEEVIEYVKPTALVGLAATFGVFTESVVRALKVSVDAGGLGRRPILFPLSNPTTKAECTFEQVCVQVSILYLHANHIMKAMNWSDGTAIFASGSPFSSFTAKIGESLETYHPNQGNNV